MKIEFLTTKKGKNQFVELIVIRNKMYSNENLDLVQLLNNLIFSFMIGMK